ncbi:MULTISPECIES: stage III sporulation protein AF [unclassified Paenibacillus]|uniref:stage III sporulation protein AF n=1 Tax=unclassified Paenibacillus TaxID=185978 RepID=UPI001AE45B19|nr:MULTISPECIES: stage III sporulation protein AF [unclassified Paenibacillus]MBP1155130.1 stage III sporulation protein AF [Paenibacillus sp. PvP091]MBP1169486.1 stage III sporulation protein AF [Paenibacillus sp. PvR098]MBP2440514.1 stage III sporulation protein AF [Paenibacillus sp. PvP052]
MDFLSGWLKSVILIILLATFVDLLLPNQSMQRYVKTVISLFLLLTLLQPLLSLFEKHAQIDQSLDSALFKQDKAWSWQTDNGMERMEPLPAIQQRAETLRLRQEEQSHRMVQSQVADLIKRKIEQTSDVQVQSVHVDTIPDENGQAVIQHVALIVDFEPTDENDAYLGRSESAENSELTKPMKPIEPVSSIRVDIGENRRDKEPVWASDDHLREHSSPEALQKQTQIMLMLEQDWQLSREQIQIQMSQTSRR